MKRSVIITAGGTGKRMGGDLPKQFLLLAGKPILFHTIERFHSFDPDAQLILSLPADWISYWKDLCKQYDFTVQHQVVEGGKERFHSIQNALNHAKGELIAVHDGVRPFASTETIRNCFEAAAQNGSAIPVVDVKESLRKVSENGSQALVRNEYRLVQTPQVFKSEILRKAYDQAYHDAITDDASLVEASGMVISLVQGNETNIKITSPADLLFAEAILEQLKDER